MNVKRAIEILTPDSTRYTPAEYEEALELAREALTCKVLEVHDFPSWRKLSEYYPPEDEDFLVSDGASMWKDGRINEGDSWYLESGFDLDGKDARDKLWWFPLPKLPKGV